MNRFYVVGFLLLMFFDTFTQICTKYAAPTLWPLDFDFAWLCRVLLEPWLYGAIAGYLGSFFMWMTLLRKAPVGPSFAASHLELVSVTLCSVWLFHEPLNFCKVAGGLLILLGVFCLAHGETVLERDGTQDSM